MTKYFDELYGDVQMIYTLMADTKFADAYQKISDLRDKLFSLKEKENEFKNS